VSALTCVSALIYVSALTCVPALTYVSALYFFTTQIARRTGRRADTQVRPPKT
jgi:hypothetical protein